MNKVNLCSNAQISRIDDGAARFMLSMAGMLHLFPTAHDGRLCDIRGGIQAKQWGMVYYAARLLLRNGIHAYLIGKGYNRLSTPILIMKLLAIDTNENPDIYKEACELEYANPLTPNEIKAYAERCTEFVEDKLEMKYILDWTSRRIATSTDESPTYGFTEALENLGPVRRTYPTALRKKAYDIINVLRS